MDLEVRKDVAFNTTYSRWVKDDIDAFERQMSKARIKKDGYFYKNDYTRLVAWAGYAFHSIAHFFVFTDEMRDEQSALLRALESLPAEQFKVFASLIFEPYKDINPIQHW